MANYLNKAGLQVDTQLVTFVETAALPGTGVAAGAFWSGRLAAMLFSLFATLDLAKVNLRIWLTWFLQSCADQGGRIPLDIPTFLPWNMSPEQRRAMAIASDDSS